MRLDKDLQVSTSAARSQAYVDALTALLAAPGVDHLND